MSFTDSSCVSFFPFSSCFLVDIHHLQLSHGALFSDMTKSAFYTWLPPSRPAWQVCTPQKFQRAASFIQAAVFAVPFQPVLCFPSYDRTLLVVSESHNIHCNIYVYILPVFSVSNVLVTTVCGVQSL